MAYWIKITYDRNDYVIDLERIAAFCHAASGKVSFALPDGNTIITLTQQGDPEGYQTILDFVEKQTGYSLAPSVNGDMTTAKPSRKLSTAGDDG